MVEHSAVSATVILGLVFALVTSLAAVIAFLMKHRGVAAAPAVEIRRPVRTSLALFRSKWYLLGMLVAVGSWGFHVAALALAPISLVQSVIAGGLVFLTALADRLFGLRVTRHEVIGVVAGRCGTRHLAATLDGGANGAHDHYRTATLVAYVTVIIGLGVAAAAWARTMPVGGPLLGVATGCLWGASDICIKALAGGLADEHARDPHASTRPGHRRGIADGRRHLGAQPAGRTAGRRHRHDDGRRNHQHHRRWIVVFGEPFPPRCW